MITIRVGTYNILDGAGDGRAGGQAAMFAGEGLDLLIASECMGPGWEPGGDLRRGWEDRLGMWSAGHREPGDGDVPGRHCVIFGRHGRVRPGAYRPVGGRPHAWRGPGLLEVTVEGYPHVITVLGVHGHTFSPEIRAAEARLAARCFISAPGPAIVAGDRNSLHGRPAGPRWAHLPPGDPEPDWQHVDPARLICHWLLDANGDPVTGPGGQMICDRRPSHLMTAAATARPAAGRLTVFLPTVLPAAEGEQGHA
jgi:hypothetical protein